MASINILCITLIYQCNTGIYIPNNNIFQLQNHPHKPELRFVPVKDEIVDNKNSHPLQFYLPIEGFVEGKKICENISSDRKKLKMTKFVLKNMSVKFAKNT